MPTRTIRAATLRTVYRLFPVFFLSASASAADTPCDRACLEGFVGRHLAARR